MFGIWPNGVAMNWYFFSAGVLSIVIGAVHSYLGERLIFARMRTAGLVPTDGGQALRERQVRILWASWHIPTAMGGAIGVVLFWFSLPASSHLVQPVVAMALGGAMLASSGLVLVGTKGRHPGWAGLLGVAVLTGLGLYA
jgi:hypothetical protein